MQSQTVSVTAVPAEGHVFVKWSDGVTSKTRTDTKFKQNLDVTAVFAAVSVEVSSEGKGLFSGSYIFHAKISGKYASSDTIRWYANGEEVKAAAGQTTVSVPASSVANGSYKIYAVVTYNDCKVSSNTPDADRQRRGRLQQFVPFERVEQLFFRLLQLVFFRSKLRQYIQQLRQFGGKARVLVQLFPQHRRKRFQQLGAFFQPGVQRIGVQERIQGRVGQ